MSSPPDPAGFVCGFFGGGKAAQISLGGFPGEGKSWSSVRAPQNPAGMRPGVTPRGTNHRGKERRTPCGAAAALSAPWVTHRLPVTSPSPQPPAGRVLGLLLSCQPRQRPPVPRAVTPRGKDTAHAASESCGRDFPSSQPTPLPSAPIPQLSRQSWGMSDGMGGGEQQLQQPRQRRGGCRSSQTPRLGWHGREGATAPAPLPAQPGDFPGSIPAIPALPGVSPRCSPSLCPAPRPELVLGSHFWKRSHIHHPAHAR